MNSYKKLTGIALIFSVVALATSVYSVVSSASFSDDESFNEKVEVGIESYIKKQQEAAMAAQAAANVPAAPINVSIDDDAVKGDKNAPVTIVEFSEYQCPFCKRYVDDAFVQIKQKYIDTGKVKYVFRDFPLSFHENAKPAAIASECVKSQGGDEAYWEYHDILFANQSAITPDDLKKYASNMGYDIANCLDNEEFADEIEKDFNDGQSYGVQGTPAFFINGHFLSGAQPFANFEQIIEQELNK